MSKRWENLNFRFLPQFPELRQNRNISPKAYISQPWPRGLRVQAHVGTTPGRHITLAAAMCPVSGFVFHQILEKAMNGHLFGNFLAGLNATLAKAGQFLTLTYFS